MDENLVHVYAILGTLRDLNAPTPESIIYLAIGMDIDQYQRIRTVMVSSGLCKVSGNLVSLTPIGEQYADKVNEAIEKEKAKRTASV